MHTYRMRTAIIDWLMEKLRRMGRLEVAVPVAPLAPANYHGSSTNSTEDGFSDT